MFLKEFGAFCKWTFSTKYFWLGGGEGAGVGGQWGRCLIKAIRWFDSAPGGGIWLFWLVGTVPRGYNGWRTGSGLSI